MRRHGTTAQTIILIAAMVLFLIPPLSSALFGFSLPDRGFTLEPLLRVLDSESFLPQIALSLQLAALTTVAGFVLVVPTLIWLHLRAPRLLRIAETFSVLPYVIPAVAIVNGASLVFRPTIPGFLTSAYSLVPFYVILVLPFLYRAVDAGLRSLDLRTIYSASESLGAGPIRSIVTIVLPNLRGALMSGALISFAITLGEFVLASLLLHETFPVFLAHVATDSPRAAVALTFLTIVGTWLLLAGLAGAGLGTRLSPSARTSAKATRGTLVSHEESRRK